MSLFKISPKTIVLGGLAIAAAAGALKNRDKVAGLIGARSSAPEPPRPEPAPPRTGDPAAPAPSNYDLGGPAANTATKVPAPEVSVRDDDGGIDERAEEAAAAAEAAAIGGTAPEYPGLGMDEAADDARRPLMEAGEGESEGEELADFDLRDEAEARSGETSDAEQQVNATIEQAGNPTVGESIEAVEAHAPESSREEEKLGAATADDAGNRIGTGGPRGSTDVTAGPSTGATTGPQGPDAGTTETAAATESPASNGGGSQSGLGFAGGKVGGEEDPAPGLPNTAAAEAAGEAAQADDAPQIHPDQTSLLDEPRETPAAEKSAAVWQPPTPTEGEGEDDDDDGSDWQTWSGRAVK